MLANGCALTSAKVASFKPVVAGVQRSTTRVAAANLLDSVMVVKVARAM